MTETAKATTGAPSDVGTNWHSIDWKAVHTNVKRLQARMAPRRVRHEALSCNV